MIIYPKKFKQAPSANFDGLFDWDFLLSVFEGTNIQPMDIDAIIERKGKILIFETKDNGKDIPLGQRILLEQIIKIGRGKIHLIIIYGKTPEAITGMDEWYYSQNGVSKSGIRVVKAREVLARVSKWFSWANKESNRR